MSDMRNIFDNIMDVIYSLRHSFWHEYGYEPNKIIMSRDIFNIINFNTRDLITCFSEENTRKIMGMDIEIVLDKKGYIEVGLMYHTPFIINTDYGNKPEK